MKLIEVVVLAGAHCISPVQQTGATTEAAKVQCAVVIEKDTESGTLRIVPAGSSREPQVVAVLERLDREGSATTIEPAFAPPAVPPAAIAADVAQAPAAEPEQADAVPPAAETAKAEIPVEAEKPAKPKKAEAKKADAKKKSDGEAETAAEAKMASKCRGEAKPKWYTNEEGRRKYRCVLPG
jgi:hypothetical protein